jgi:uncharacterized membrane protein
MSDVSDSSATGEASSEPTIEGLFAELEELSADDRKASTRDEIRDVKHLLAEAHDRGLIDSNVRELRTRDAAEAFIGSVIFASPLLVEDGIFDIADHLFGVTVSGVPVFLIVNTLFVVFMTYALLEWTGRDRAEARTVLGFPVRVFMTLAVSFVVATLLMTVWGRVGGWSSPIEAVARINVIWTVGSLGAALGDILADSDPGPEGVARGEGRDRTPSAPAGDVDRLSDSALVDALYDEFDDLEGVVDDPTDRRTVDRIRAGMIEATLDDGFGDTIQKYTPRDIAEAFVGSIFFAIPFLVEDGVFDIADFFLSFRIGLFPVYFLVNAAFVLLIVFALVYWAGPQDVRMSRPLLGIVPRRLVGTALISFLTSAALMTMWGRVDSWQDPVVALARISVVWTVASLGAALGDILPGESSGDDITDDLAALGERIGGGEGSSEASDD